MAAVLDILRKARAENRRLLAVLFDPDDDPLLVDKLAERCEHQQVDLVLVGGSLLTRGHTEDCLRRVKAAYSGPVLLFPGNEIQIVPGADALLLLSLLSGRNPDYLIGKHVVAAPFIKESGIPTIPTGYLLIESGALTTANYISQSLPVPHNKPDIAAVTALAGSQLGMQIIYLDAGSGAENPVSSEMIRRVVQTLPANTPVFAGGGIRDAETAAAAWDAGATTVVVGNGLTANPELMSLLTEKKRQKQA
jgi:putative glycerol-1-phosphate prenyltransferase